jgi:acid phosphatase (class A)
MKFTYVLAIALISIQGTFAKEPANQGVSLKYLSAGDIAPAALLPPPASDGSQSQLDELAELRQIAKARSDERLKQARLDDEIIGAAIFESAIPGFNTAKHTITAKLLDGVKRESNAVSHAAKLYFDRKRPYEFDPELNVCAQHRGKNATYPSGHTTVGFAMASILARLVPTKSANLMARAEEYGRSRMICGVHYRSDVSAGQVIGTAVALALVANPQFQSEMAAAKAELVAAGLTN